MVMRPFLATCLVLVGLLLVLAGLGHTVDRAARVGSTTDTPWDHATGPYEFLPEQDGDWGSYHPLLQPSDPSLPDQEEGAPDLARKRPFGTSFVFPALSLLSGAVLSAMGAIALLHRWRGIK
jgi:hypothetical protein